MQTDIETHRRATATYTALSLCFERGLPVSGHLVDRSGNNGGTAHYVLELRCDELQPGMNESAFDSVGRIITGAVDVTVIEKLDRSNRIVPCDVISLESPRSGILRIRALAKIEAVGWSEAIVHEALMHFLSHEVVVKVVSEKRCVLIP